MTSAPRPRPPTPTPPVAQWVTLTGPVRSNTFRRPGVLPRVLPPPGTPWQEGGQADLEEEQSCWARCRGNAGPFSPGTCPRGSHLPAGSERPSSRHRLVSPTKVPVPVGSVRWIPARCALARDAHKGGRQLAGGPAGHRHRLGPDKGSSVRTRPPARSSEPPVPPGGGGGGGRCLAGGSLPQLPCLHPTSVPVGEWPQGPASGCRPGAGGQQPSGPPSSPSSGLPLPRLRAPTPCSGHPLAQGPLAAHQGLRGFLSHEVSVVSLPPGRALSKLPVSPGAGPGGASRAASRRAEQETGPPASAQAQGHPCPSALIVRQRRPFGLCSPDKACVLCPPPRKPGPALAESILV